MTTDATGTGVTEEALASLHGAADPRLRELLADLAREVTAPVEQAA